MTEMLRAPDDGASKMYLICAVLACRARYPGVFQEGEYRQVKVAGGQSRHVVAYARVHGRTGVVVVAGRLFAALCGHAGALPCGPDVWHDTSIDLGWLPDDVTVRDTLTGHRRLVGATRDRSRVSVGELLRGFPVSILEFSSSE
ncbi:MAG: hypothetical protein GC151_21155 [Betaproteobacteria bacterium]|nr:hypothetical protein [Betaproteobacteria bacterium]